jgi:SAM-dependent methyltransferase
MNLYDRDYYECGVESGKSCYNNYRWIPELTIPMCFRMIEYLKISEGNKILDFGCAKGFSVKAFRLLNRECWGYDISEYAINSAPSEITDFLSSDLGSFDVTFDWVIAKDVLEHISYEQIDDILLQLFLKSKNIFAVVPLGDGHRYNVPAYELDKTHVIRENKSWWIEKFIKAGFNNVSFSYRVPGIKENWKHYKDGNGFFTGREFNE